MCLFTAKRISLFTNCFHDAQEGFAIEINHFIKYKKGLELNEVSKKVRNAPQSFIYI